MLMCKITLLHLCHCAPPAFEPASLSSAFSYPPLSFTQQAHAQVLTYGLQQNPFLATNLISAYDLCGNPTKSKLVFHSIELKSVYLWNSLINGYVRNFVYNEAFELFEKLCNCNVLPDDYTLATVAKFSGKVHLVARKSVHGKSIRVGYVLHTVVANSLMPMYCKCGNFGECRKVFEEMAQRNVGSWNAITA
ncbi:pentatricopeptide repeat-containing protein [Prunus yedoensis var. nudiflora]|uniref:Pentatricopeptide repeat-containing protein n=1 Tax=Prunus yedoensis var. nudiflora TaxID=2094558 RepID=A0A314UGJ1_PRUYE|nr:pentatricopeptide repeat-containing protein [Prunus yedoensis var. nudiflora]